MMCDIICSCMDAYLYIVYCTCYLFILLLTSNNCEISIIRLGIRSVTGMAGSISLKPPAAFNFRKPDEWPQWLKRFEQFQLASGLSKEKHEVKQISILLYCLGEEAESVLASTHITLEERPVN